jgi:hypothetical protein
MYRSAWTTVFTRGGSLIQDTEETVGARRFRVNELPSTERYRRSSDSISVVRPRLCREYGDGRYQVNFEFHPWQSGITELVEHGQLDLVCRFNKTYTD